MAKAQAERESRRRQREKMANEKTALTAHVELLKRFVFLLGLHCDSFEPVEALWTLHVHVLLFSQVADLTLRLQKEKDEVAAAKAALLRQTEELTAENTDLIINNEGLKVKVVNVCLYSGLEMTCHICCNHSAIQYVTLSSNT